LRSVFKFVAIGLVLTACNPPEVERANEIPEVDQVDDRSVHNINALDAGLPRVIETTTTSTSTTATEVVTTTTHTHPPLRPEPVKQEAVQGTEQEEVNDGMGTEAPPPSEGSEESGSDWDRLAQCESNGNWSINTGNGYYGGLQISKYNWDSYIARGREYAIANVESYPDYPHLASRNQQIEVAVRIRDGVPGSSNPYLNAQGWGAWPECSRKVGLR